MKKYLIRIESGGHSVNVTINGDSCRPFMIAHNLWSYTTPGHAARRLETLAQAWENNGHAVARIFGSVSDMPATGNRFNIEKTPIDFNASTKTYRQIVNEYYHY